MSDRTHRGAPPVAADPDWSPDAVPGLAHRAGIDSLSDLHWKVIASCREDAARRGRPPGLRRLAELTGLAPGELERLFPGGAEALVARIAGFSRRRPAPRGRADDGSHERSHP